MSDENLGGGGVASRGFKVHAEEDFISDLEAIVERDFYPDLPRLRAQQRYLDARALGGGSVAMVTPGQTPAVTPTVAVDPAAPAFQPQQHTAAPPTVGLDTYLTGNTSEDNASFQALLDESERRRHVKYAWFYQQADALKALKSGEDSDAAASTSISAAEVTSTSTTVTAGLDSWPGYRVRSALMYSPDDADADDAKPTVPASLVLPETRRQIVHANTRFRQAPFSRPATGGGEAASAAGVGALFDGVFRRPGVPGRIGPDGRELGTPGRSASSAAAAAAAMSYLATPTPSPGVGESPLMTWGNIDGTPCRLDEASIGSPALGPGSATPSAAAAAGLPYFRIPAMPTVQLADRLGRHRRLARRRDTAVNFAIQEAGLDRLYHRRIRVIPVECLVD